MTLTVQTRRGPVTYSLGRDAQFVGGTGYKLRIVEIDPANTAAPVEWERTVSTRSGDIVTLTSGLSAPAWDATKKYRAWFVGLAPISRPRIIVAVRVDEPNNGKHCGGDVAAPVFSEVVQQTLRTLGVAPALEVASPIITSESPGVEESC